jgi:hypothetical protein
VKLKRQVVMLPTNQRLVNKGDLVLGHGHNMFVASGNMRPNSLIADYYKSQHLYITSDEEIKEGDWYIDDTNTIRQSVTSDGDYWSRRKDYKKIIATTDKSIAVQKDSITICSGKSRINTYPTEKTIIPSPSPEFVQAYIKAYNAGKPITEVMVEYEESCCDIRVQGGVNSPDCCHKHAVQLKVDSNNCITITKVKDSWTREEVINILHKYLDDSSTKNEAFHKILEEQLNQWIEQNL